MHVLQHIEPKRYWQLKWKRLPPVGEALQELSGSVMVEVECQTFHDPARPGRSYVHPEDCEWVGSLGC
ncbi:UNVERIFIED_CONTAM: hypothetical protein Sradi_6447800 [Sesamum radiatum]|uniref:Uncharacterized protein n=1 Tax=Sesamum radiatum TaxID=300843 RepID=A0AAW2K4Y1_SESRA